MSLPTLPRTAAVAAMPGLIFKESVYYQLTPDELIRDCLRRGEGELSDSGALVIKTGEFTGRSPKDRFIVRDEITSGRIDWNDFNQPIGTESFGIVLEKMTDYLNRLPEKWIRDCRVCADKRFSLNIRVVTETPAINLFACNMFIRPSEAELEHFLPDWQILSAPNLRLNPAECGVRQHNAVIISFCHKIILLAGTGYTGETKKAVFTILNYLLPAERHILPMHCSANIGKSGDTAIFFGLSGTGKTTLSADPSRRLIGDDEHGWAKDNIFNFEGGCYAKCINLNKEKEPAIFQAIRPGSLVENVPFLPGSRELNFEDGSITENTRVSYPLHYIGNVQKPSLGGLPRNIFFLTCDAYGVLPPISRLNAPQAMYQFISGYTAKVAGTETGITEPKSTFSACFGAPFLPLHPAVYAEMLGERIRQSQTKVWLVNTGWTGGPYLRGNRIHLSITRAIILAVLEGRLDPGKGAGQETDWITHPIFGFEMPVSCPGVPELLLNPRETWADKLAYDKTASELARQFQGNFEKYSTYVSREIIEASPKIP